MSKAVSNKITKQKRILYAFVLGGLAALGPLCTELYLPALPQIADFLHTGTLNVQLSITSSLVGLAVGQLFIGPFSDAKGRRGPLLLSLALFTTMSILCAQSTSITELVLYRFLQGLTGAGGIVLSRAIACDLYSGVELTKFFALLMLINGVAPIAAPVLGGQILQIAAWPATFYFLAICGTILYSMVFFGCTESLPPEKRSDGGLKNSFIRMGRLFQNKTFMCYVFVQGFTMAGFFSYISASPFVLQNIYGLTAQQFSYCFGINGLGMMLVAQLAGGLSMRFGDARVLRGGMLVTLTASICVLCISWFGAALPVWFMLVGLFMAVCCLGLTMTTSFTLAVASQSEGAGSASGLLGVAVFLFGAIMSPLVGIGGSDTAVPMGVAMVLSTFMALFFYHKTQTV